MNKVMYILVNKDLKGKMTAQKLAGQVAHAAATYIYRHAHSDWMDIELYFTNNQTKIILECPESKLLEYEKDRSMIPIRDAGHTELEPGTLTCVCAGIFDKDKDEVPKALQKMQLLHWETVLNYEKYYTGKEILELISKDRIPHMHIIEAYESNKKYYGHGCDFVYRDNEGYDHIELSFDKEEMYIEEAVKIDYLLRTELIFKIKSEEFKGEINYA